MSAHRESLQDEDLAKGAENRAAGRLALSASESVAVSSAAPSVVSEGWVALLGDVDELLEAHSRRVVTLADELAGELGASDVERKIVREGALLHDIGKLGLPASILRKRGELTRREWWQMTWHPGIARWMLGGLDLRPEVLEIPYYHHERWDGAGYPRGLRGGEIPLRARLFSVVDVWDALSHDRLYRPAWPRREVVGYLVQRSGSAFDPSIVSAFLRVLGEDRNPADQALRYGDAPASGAYGEEGDRRSPAGTVRSACPGVARAPFRCLRPGVLRSADRHPGRALRR